VHTDQPGAPLARSKALTSADCPAVQAPSSLVAVEGAVMAAVEVVDVAAVVGVSVVAGCVVAGIDVDVADVLVLAVDSSSLASSLVHAAIPASPSVTVSTALHDSTVRIGCASHLTRTGHVDDGAAVNPRRGSAR
jgi:hypothetical protein